MGVSPDPPKGICPYLNPGALSMTKSRQGKHQKVRVDDTKALEVTPSHSPLQEKSLKLHKGVLAPKGKSSKNDRCFRNVNCKKKLKEEVRSCQALKRSLSDFESFLNSML